MMQHAQIMELVEQLHLGYVTVNTDTLMQIAQVNDIVIINI